MRELQDLMASIQRMGEEEPQPVAPERLDLLMYAPCPVKLAVKEQIERIAREYADEGAELAVHIPMGCTSVDPYDPVSLETDPDRLPAAIASIGFGDFWKRGFAERFVRPGLFEAVLPERVNPLYEDAGLVDPDGRYTIYGVTPYIFLVDEKRLGGLPAPRAWADLLDPRYRGRIVMCGDGDDMADAVLLTMYKDFGIEGVRTLAGSACGLMHSSTMAKVAGSPGGEEGAIFIIPCFFAYSTKQPAHVRVVWPEDGAAASPLYLLVKKREKARLGRLLSFFTSGFARIGSASWFAPLDGAARSPLPPEARLKWVGWEFIRENDVNALRDELGAAFRAVRRGLE